MLRVQLNILAGYLYDQQLSSTPGKWTLERNIKCEVTLFSYKELNIRSYVTLFPC